MGNIIKTFFTFIKKNFILFILILFILLTSFVYMLGENTPMRYIGGLITLIFSSIIIFWTSLKPAKKGKLFILQRFGDIFIFLLIYFVAVWSINSSQVTSLMYKFNIISYLILGLYFLFTNFFGIYIFYKLNKYISDTSNGITFKIYIIQLFMGIILSFSLIYYSLYSLNNSWFDIGEIKELPKLAFEFIYYSFTMTITYDSSEITAVGIIPKIVQMGHVIIFYLFFANIIVELFQKNKKDES